MIEFYSDREGAEEALRQALWDEPRWKNELRVVPVDLAETAAIASPN